MTWTNEQDPKTRTLVPPSRSTCNNNRARRPVACRRYWAMATAETASGNLRDGGGCWTHRRRRRRCSMAGRRQEHRHRCRTGTRPSTITSHRSWAVWVVTRPNHRWPTTTTGSAGTQPTSSGRWTGSRWSSPSGWSTKCCFWARWACWTSTPGSRLRRRPGAGRTLPVRQRAAGRKRVTTGTVTGYSTKRTSRMTKTTRTRTKTTAAIANRRRRRCRPSSSWRLHDTSRKTADRLMSDHRTDKLLRILYMYIYINLSLTIRPFR